MTAVEIAPATTDRALSNKAFILRNVEVYNWGPFGDYLHKAEIDPRGTAIIGPTGSGKTTLIDALLTLITAQPKYNLASTGGHESDRDLMSYIRGVAGAGNDSGDNLHIARPGKTVTAIAARFANGEQQVQMSGLFWIDGTSSAPSDLKRLWIFSERDDRQLEDWLTLHHESGARALKQIARELPGVQIFDSKKAYLAQLRRFFEVGENAFTLLNRAAGLKQLNSIDEIFRELVLDDHSAFGRAAEVAAEFDDLAAIHAELKTARKQQQSLTPIKQTHEAYRACEQQLSEHRTLLTILPIWFALAGHQLWRKRIEDIDGDISQLTDSINGVEHHADDLQGKADTLKDIYLQAGGASIEQLKEQIATQKQLTDERQRNAQGYRTLAKNLALDDTLSHDALRANQARVSEQKTALQAEIQCLQSTQLNLGADLVTAQKQVADTQQELAKIQARPGSNIPGHFQDFRADLAEALNLPEDALPFTAELVEVKAEEARWRGAIERALGGHRLRLLVPPAAMQSALDWINQRNNRLHVRLLEAKPPQTATDFFNDGFTRKLNFKNHTHREALKHFLATIDRHCVDSPQALRETPHGLTAEGTMSGKSGHFEKQDQRALNEGWMTGFDNKDRVASLTRELEAAKQEERERSTEYRNAQRQLRDTEAKVQLQQQLADLSFDSIDLPGAEAKLASLKERLDALMDPNSTTGRARREFEQVENELKALRQQLQSLHNQRSSLQERRATAENYRLEAYERIGEGLTDAQQTLADQHLRLPDDCPPEKLNQHERHQRERLEKARTELNDNLQRLQRKLIQQMADAKNADTGALAEVGKDLPDIPDYLERLRVLTEEALPEKLKRFLAYLNQSSDQGVAQLLKGIENDVSIIEERITDLNKTLRRVDFQQGRYLQLEPQRVVHESLRTLQKAQRYLRSAALKEDNGESHYQALADMVQLLRNASDSKRTLGARALLDPRYRLQFAVAVRERETDDLIERRTGSQGGSGGEKEIIASYILTASLSYALCPDGATTPLFATIILDEAFSKSSHAVAGRIISALQEFGLHPLFVTPNKEMRLLRCHTRSAILVHRKGTRASLTSLTWEELEAHAEQKIRARNEVPR